MLRISSTKLIESQGMPPQQPQQQPQWSDPTTQGVPGGPDPLNASFKPGMQVVIEAGPGTGQSGVISQSDPQTGKLVVTLTNGQ